MFQFLKVFSLFALVPLINAAPEKRQFDPSTYCGQYDSVVQEPYTFYINQWGKIATTQGQSCGRITSLNGNTIGWENSWTWDGDGIKSYTNMNLNQGINKQLSAIQSIPVDWQWSNQFSGSVVSNVALDLFTADAPGQKNANEIMIWLANYNSQPISYNFDAQGNAVPVQTSVALAGQNWNLYIGTNTANVVFSFLPSTAGTEIKSFNTDVNVFAKYLANQNLSQTQYLTTVQAGVEATSGSAVFTTTSYSAAVN
ncbi:hypothetical protein V5O48_004681 [Marasmius crinis-equi]|uniref:Glycoside hydrolase family 12 protein n=1 Tax=Marasmius crinis-equi TaxID=585013 RepID=A0ABR3FPF9_9AGAR